MGARKKIAKLEKKVQKLRTKFVLARSDLRFLLESETYRANLAESKVRNLSNELDALKVKLTVLERTSTTQLATNDTRTESASPNVSVAEVNAGTPSNNGSAPVPSQVS